MTKNIFILSVLAIFATVFVSSCKKEDKYACTKSEFLGNYNGAHQLSTERPIKIDIPIADNVIISEVSGTDSVTVRSTTLNKTFVGVVSDCKVLVSGASLDSFQTSLGTLGTATVKNINANLEVRKNTTKNQIETVIKVISGTAVISTALGTTTETLTNVDLKGTFK